MSSYSPTISVIIPNYNGKHLLEKNLPKIITSLKDYPANKEIIVADDSSTDNSQEFLESFVKNYSGNPITVIYLHSEKKENMGFPANVDRAVAKAAGDIVVLLNSDVYPQNDFIYSLVSHFSDEHVFAVGAMDKSIEDEKTVLRGRGVGNWQRGFLIHRLGALDKTNTLWASGGSSAFRRSIWHKLGGMDTLFSPFYWEDIDLSYRALKSGYKVLFDKNSMVVHEHEKGAIKSNFSNFTVKRIAYRNQFFFVWKNADILTLIFHIVWFPYHFAAALLRIDIPFYAGFISALIKLPFVLEKRFATRKMFTKSDKEVISNVKV